MLPCVPESLLVRSNLFCYNSCDRQPRFIENNKMNHHPMRDDHIPLNLSEMEGRD